MPEGDPAFGREVDLFDLGYVDSAGIVALVAWIEERYDLELSEDDLFDERFTTVDGIAAIIAARRQTTS